MRQHNVARFVLNTTEGNAALECTCGWELHRDNITEMFDEWYDHKVGSQLEEIYGAR